MDDLLNKEPVQRVQNALKSYSSKIKVQILDQSARTANEASNALNCDVGAIVKSLLLKTENDFILCLISGDKRCSLNKIKKMLNQKDVSMANAESVKEITGFTIGGVSPIGLITNLTIIIDINLSRFEDIYAAAGHPNAIFKIKSKDLQKITSSKTLDISE